MAIRVVGLKPELKQSTACQNCAAVLEYLPSDVCSRSFREIDGVQETVHYVRCPQCGKEVRTN